MTDSLPAAVLAALGLPMDVPLQRLAGNANQNYLARHDGLALVIKRLLDYPAANAELEAMYRKHLAAAGLPVSKYVVMTNGKYTMSTDGNDYAAAEYVPGQASDGSPRSVQNIASHLARVHVTDATGLPLKTTWFCQSYIHDTLPLISQDFAASIKEMAALAAQAPDLWASTIPQGIVHGDLHCDNYITHANGTIASILDWEEAGIGPLVLDTAHAFRSLAYTDGVCSDALAEAFLCGYQRVRQLSDSERNIFEAAIRYSALLLSVWAHAKRSKGEMGDDLFERLRYKYRIPYALTLTI